MKRFKIESIVMNGFVAYAADAEEAQRHAEQLTTLHGITFEVFDTQTGTSVYSTEYRFVI